MMKETSSWRLDLFLEMVNWKRKEMSYGSRYSQ